MRGKKLFTAIATAAVVLCSFFMTACNDPSKPAPKPSGDAPTVVQPERTVTESKLTVYEGPDLLDSSEKLKAYVDNTELFVYDTRVNHARLFTYSYSTAVGQVVLFDFEGTVHMRVVISDATELTDVVVRPLSYGVQPVVSGNTVEFDLQYNANYTLEYNDGTVTDAADNALHIFANPIEENPISADNVPEDTVYIGPGVYAAGAIPMNSNQTLYLAGGAYVYGQVRAENLENITIRGRGILDGEIYDRKSASQYTLPIELRYCENVLIEGITILDPAGWAVTLYHSKDIEIDNLKIITARANGDGISVQSCENVNMHGGFVRTFDDTLVVKNTDRGNTSNITFDNVVLWTDLAQSMEVGFETNGSIMDGITFKNITVLHNYHKAAMSIHNCDDAAISNVLYQSITIEDARMLGDNQNDGLNDFLIDITIAYNAEWSKADTRGTINGVRFENIKVLEMADTIVCRINGEGPNNLVQNVTVYGVEIEGQKIDTAEKLKLANNTYVKNISVGAASYNVFGAGVELPYINDVQATTVQKTVKPSVLQNGLEVPSFAILDVQDVFMGIARDMSTATVSATHSKGTTAGAAYDDGSGAFEANDHGLANAFDGDRDTYYEAKPWTGEDDEFAAITLDFGEKLSAGNVSVIRVYLAEDSAYVYDFRISVFNKRETTASSFTRSMQYQDYTSSPATGNYFDIKLSATLESSALQLRFFRVDGMTGQKTLRINEIVIYPCSLSTTKSIVNSTDYYDVYGPNNLVDGNESTYWETSAADCNGAFFTVDLGAIYNIKIIVMHLPPLLTWEARDQQIEIQVSENGTEWTTVKESTTYTFDPITGNVNSVELDTPVSARYVKLVWSSNSSNRYGAQLSELYVYGE